MSDERDGAGSPADDDVVDAVGDDVVDDVSDTPDAAGGTRGGTAVATRPQRPTGKRSRRDATGGETPAADVSLVKNGDGKTKKPKAKNSGPGRNPFTYVWNYLAQVIAELRKVIWPNRKQMVSYTTVVLVFLAFMVALIGGVDLGLAKLVTLVFG